MENLSVPCCSTPRKKNMGGIRDVFYILVTSRGGDQIRIMDFP